MSDHQWARFLDNLQDKIERWMAVRRGELTAKKHYRRGYTVKAHKVKAHYYWRISGKVR